MAHCNLASLKVFFLSCLNSVYSSSVFLVVDFSLNVTLKTFIQSFHGGWVVKNPPANTGETGSIPILGRSHMRQSN